MIFKNESYEAVKTSHQFKTENFNLNLIIVYLRPLPLIFFKKCLLHRNEVI